MTHCGTHGISEKHLRNPALNSVTDRNKFYILLGAVAFGLNWVWEMAQMFAFEFMPDGGIEIHLFCTLAAVVDAIVTIVIYGILKSLMKVRRAKFYIAAAFLGAICAVVFEWFAFWFELWKYNSAMPVVPIIRVGLLPFVQLTLLVPLAIWLTQKFKGIRFQKT